MTSVPLARVFVYVIETGFYYLDIGPGGVKEDPVLERQLRRGSICRIERNACERCGNCLPRPV